MRRKVLISAPYFQPVIDEFLSVFKAHDIEIVVPRVEERLSEKELIPLIKDIDGVICGDDAFSEDVLKAAERLKVISKWGTGIDSIDQEACRRRNIAVKNTPDAFSEPVADSVMSYILCFARKTPWMDRAIKKGTWEKIPGTSLRERTLGIIGLGNVGRAVAGRALAFGMTVLANDIKDVDVLSGVTMTDKETLFAEADFISVNCDLNPTSRHMLNKDAFFRMKNRPFIINTARGPIIKEDDLVAALKSGQVSGAGLDVFETEPLPEKSALLQMDNVLLAPHNSNSSPSAWRRVHENTLNNLLEEFKKGEG